ncbi:ATP synthase subunit G atp20 [Teratosphaeriaceae sp. CCFEE 6253]|nr:ATP synthase subunit G atp20 [Teratosphaeriaceae sp. CCFEE 6253]
MSLRLIRLPLRQSRWLLQRRAASTTTEATNKASSTAAKAKESASDVAGKAQQGLSRVTSSAGSTISSAAERASQAVSGVGGRAGRLISFAQGMRIPEWPLLRTWTNQMQGLVPPTVYYARVVGELGKIIFQGRSMSPPTMQTIQSYMAPIQNAVRNPQALMNQTSSQASQVAGKATEAASGNPEALMSQLRNFDSGALVSVGVIAAELVGFFTVGEMIGKFKIIGYRSEGGAHH